MEKWIPGITVYVYQNIEENANKLAFYKFLYDGLARERKKIVENNEKLRLLCFLAGKIKKKCIQFVPK